MHINLEATDKHTIQAYCDSSIKIDSNIYQHSLIVSTHEIITTWPIRAINELNEESLQPLLQYNPKIIIIGHNKQGQFTPLSILQTLSKRQVGLECMSIGAACRTFNVLLSEQREVALGVIL